MSAIQMQHTGRWINNQDSYYCDTKAEADALLLTETIAHGAKAYVINEGIWYVLNGAGEWKPQKVSSGGADDLTDVSEEAM